MPQIASAHGELQIRIGEATRKIEAATNHFAQLYLERAELHREHLDWEAAKSDYDFAAELDSKLPGLDLCRAKMLDDSGQLEASRALFSDILERTPEDAEAFIGRARVLVKLGERKSAIADYRRGLELMHSSPPEYFLELAQTLASDGNTNQALHTLDVAIKKFGPTVPLQGYALDLELGRKNNDAALARIDTLIARASRKENLLTQRGEILLAAGRPEEARESFHAALPPVRLLPMLLQKAPPMQKLQSRIHNALGGLAKESNEQLITRTGCRLL